jgi:hypothetical protein
VPGKITGMKACSPRPRRPSLVRKKPARPLSRPTLYDLFKKFDGVAADLPADFAANHDHYLYGSPKSAKP